MFFCLFLQLPGLPQGMEVPEEIILSYIGKDGVRKATVEAILKRTLPHAMSSVCSISFFNRKNSGSNLSSRNNNWTLIHYAHIVTKQ